MSQEKAGAMQSDKLEAVRRELQFIGRTLANGYLDADILDELGQSVAFALRSLKEAQQPSIVGASAHQVTVYEPLAS